MFEQAFKNIDDVLWKETTCATELGNTEQTPGFFNDLFRWPYGKFDHNRALTGDDLSE